MTERSIQVDAVDLFSGAGGLTHGLASAGISVRVGVDIDPACEYPYTENNEADFLLKSVGDIDADDLVSYYRRGNVRLLAGCAPCQTFSSYNQRASDEDDRWWLLRHFSKLAGDLLPELVTMENVPGLLKHAVFDEFVTVLEENGYEVSKQVVSCQDYGLPQQRNRLVLLASRIGQISLLTPPDFEAEPMSVRDAIGKVPALSAGSAHPMDPLHQSAGLSTLNQRRIKASKPGGTWRDWPEDLVADCHKKNSGRTYAGVYGRMAWDGPAPTMTTQFYGFGSGRFGHPSQNRAISLREGAILQSFPPGYKFVRPGDPVHMKTIGRLIGNAVPVMLGELIGKSVNAHLERYSAEVRRELAERAQA